MTTVADSTIPGPDPGPVARTFPALALAVIRSTAEHAAQSDHDDVSEAELIDQIAHLESVQNSLAALQATLVRTFARTHVATRIASGTDDPAKLERSVAAQIGLACQVSPTVGRTRLRTARDLREGLDHVRDLFTVGRLSAHKVSIVVTVTSDLDRAERSDVDRRLAEHDIARLSMGRLRTLARSLAAEISPEKFRARTAAARSSRRVTLRPNADGMTDLIAHLPVEQGVACYAALHKAVNDIWARPEPVTRARGQILADTLVERLTGQTTADQVNVQVQIVVPVEALVDPTSPLPAEIPGHGPVPTDLLATTTGKKTWRRLVTREGIVIGGDSSQRHFTGTLAALIRARDHDRCTEPYCDAPARQIDHVQQVANHGRTTFDNSRSVCELHNYLREQPGWRVDVVPDGGVRTTTPTGHSYLHRPEPRPETGRPRRRDR